MATTPAAGTTADYSTDRHTALHLVNTGQIISTNAMPRCADGAYLDPSVFAALLRLGRAGYIELRLPAPGSPAAGSHCPARLTVAGLQMLTRFRQAHGRCPPLSVAARPTTASTMPRA